MTKNCTKCHKNLPTGFFFVDKKKPGGIYSSCKDCYRLRLGLQKRLPKEIEKQGVILRRCGRCKEYKRKQEFYTNKGARDGWSGNCKKCYAFFGASERSREGKKTRNAKKREIVLGHYGGKPPRCSCCGESTYKFLCLDHIHNNGSEHRASLNTDIYSWIIRNDYPDGFQVLCHNCNFAKSAYGGCPHKYEANTERNTNAVE